MSQQHPGYKRRNYFIKQEFQFKFIMKFLAVLLAGGVLSTILVFVFSRGTLTSSFDHSRLMIRNTAEAIMPTLVVTNLVTLCIITLAAIGVTLFVSHRIAGPMFRFEQDLKKIAQGDLAVRIHLRQKDQFSEMAKAFNEMAVSVHGKVTDIDLAVDRILTRDKQNRTCADYEKMVSELKEMIHKNFSL